MNVAMITILMDAVWTVACSACGAGVRLYTSTVEHRSNVNILIVWLAVLVLQPKLGVSRIEAPKLEMWSLVCIWA